MTASGDDNIGTSAVRDKYQFDQAALARWMTVNVNGFKGPLYVEQFRGGQSNPTYKLTTPSQNYVLRRRPPGELVRGAHAVEREARVLTGLRSADFPVPQVFGLCTDDTIIGTWFYVMAMVEGRIFWDATLPSQSCRDRAQLYDAMNTTIAQLHKVDIDAANLSDFGRPGSYFERQITRWSRQYVDDIDAGRDPDMDRMIDWLPRNIPDGDEASIVHGDFRIDNIIFHPTENRVVAVLDWELSTLGHPLADFAYHAMMYHVPPHIVAGLAGSNLEALGIPSEADYVESYCRRTGRDMILNYPFYLAFNAFRLAAIFHGIKGRVARGTAASANAVDRAFVFPEVAQLAWRLTQTS